MRYPLAFGILTALLASGVLLKLAANNKHQQDISYSQQWQQRQVKEYRFHDPVVPHLTGKHAWMAQRQVPRAPETSCRAEQTYAELSQLDSAGIFQQLGWLRVRKNGDRNRYPIRVTTVRPVAVSTQSDKPTSVPARWNCQVGYQPSRELMQGIQKAMVTSARPKSPVVRPFHAVRQSTSRMLPADAIQRSCLPEGLPHRRPKSTTARDWSQQTAAIWQMAEQISDQLIQQKRAWQLVINAFPSHPDQGGCGISSQPIDVTDELEVSTQTDRLTQAVLDSVCQVHRVQAQQIQHDPFFRQRNVSSLPPQTITSEPVLGQIVANIWTESIRKLRHQLLGLGRLCQPIVRHIGPEGNRLLSMIEGIRPPVGNVSKHPTTSMADIQMQDWNYLTDLELPSLSGPWEPWEWSEMVGQMRNANRQPTGLAPIQPIPAANYLGIVAGLENLTDWIQHQTGRWMQQSTEAGQALAQWGLQQNATWDRMVLQQDTPIRR